MRFTAQQLGVLLNGTVDGDADVAVDQLCKIEEGRAGCLTFLANPKYEHYLYNTEASIVVVSKNLELTHAVKPTLIRVTDPYSSFSTLLEKYDKKSNKQGIEQPSFIHPSATVGQGVYIGAFAYIGPGVVVGDGAKIYPQVYLGDRVKVGSGSTLYPGVKVYDDCVVGNNVIIHSSTVIGSDGFGFAPQADGTYQKVSQIGNVVIGDDVEVGSNTSIDRATIGSTVIHKGVKLDNLIQVAHNVEIGVNTVIASQTGVSGSSKIGGNAVIGGQVGIVGHITIARGSQIQAKSGVHRSIEEEGKKWAGAPLLPYTNHMRAQVVAQRLPELERRIAELEKQLGKLKNS
jgi:UDP-3-O-[3-hydroxymyristoyl] glucosamine N-acyltransferase